MAANITTNTSTTFGEVNAGKVAFVKVTGNWSGTSIAIQVQNGNSAYETYPTDGTQTANFAKYFQVGDQDGLRLVSTGVMLNTTSLWAQVVEVRP